MRFVILLGVRPVTWAKLPATERDRITADIDVWFDEHAADGTLVEHVRFQKWKDARTVTDGADTPGPLLIGPNGRPDGVLVAQATVECSSIKKAVALAKTWPIPDAVAEVRPIETT